MKKTVLILLVLALFVLSSCAGENQETQSQQTADTPNEPAQETFVEEVVNEVVEAVSPKQEMYPITPTSGKMYVAVTDEAVDMGTVSEIEFTMTNFELYSQKQGWITVSSDEKTFALLDLNARSEFELYVENNLERDLYTRMRFDIVSVEVFDNDGSHDAVVPSSDYTVEMKSTVRTDEESTILIDVQAKDSIHKAEDGTYVFAPVAEIRTEVGGDVALSGSIVTTSDGDIVEKKRVGMNIEGDVGLGFSIPSTEKITVNGEVVTFATLGVQVS